MQLTTDYRVYKSMHNGTDQNCKNAVAKKKKKMAALDEVTVYGVLILSAPRFALLIVSLIHMLYFLLYVSILWKEGMRMRTLCYFCILGFKFYTFDGIINRTRHHRLLNNYDF